MGNGDDLGYDGVLSMCELKLEPFKNLHHVHLLMRVVS